MQKTIMEKAHMNALIYTVLAYLSLGLGTYAGPIIFNSLDIFGAFSRAGAVMVLFSMIAEVYIQTAWGGNIPTGSFHEDEDIPSEPQKHIKRVKLLRPFTNFGAISGTVIWAYGDLILKALVT